VNYIMMLLPEMKKNQKNFQDILFLSNKDSKKAFGRHPILI